MSKEGHFSDRMTARIQSIESRLVVGIDPRLDCLPDGIEADDPEQALTHLGVGVIEAVAGFRNRRPLWSAPTCRRFHIRRPVINGKSSEMEAATSRRTPN